MSQLREIFITDGEATSSNTRRNRTLERLIAGDWSNRDIARIERVDQDADGAEQHGWRISYYMPSRPR